MTVERAYAAKIWKEFNCDYSKFISTKQEQRARTEASNMTTTVAIEMATNDCEP